MTNDFDVIKTAAEAALGENLFDKEKWKSVNYNRYLDAIAVVGSTNIADFAGEVWVGEARKGEFHNTQGGANVAPNRDDFRYPKALVPKNQEIQFIVTDAALANNVIVSVKFSSARSRRRANFIRAAIRNPAAYAAAVARNRRR